MLASTGHTREDFALFGDGHLLIGVGFYDCPEFFTPKVLIRKNASHAAPRSYLLSRKFVTTSFMSRNRWLKPISYDHDSAFQVIERIDLRTGAAQPEMYNSMSSTKLTLFVVDTLEAKISPLLTIKLPTAIRVGTLRNHLPLPHASQSRANSS